MHKPQAASQTMECVPLHGTCTFSFSFLLASTTGQELVPGEGHGGFRRLPERVAATRFLLVVHSTLRYVGIGAWVRHSCRPRTRDMQRSMPRRGGGRPTALACDARLKLAGQSFPSPRCQENTLRSTHTYRASQNLAPHRCCASQVRLQHTSHIPLRTL